MGETKEYKLPEEGNTLMVNEPQKNWGGRWTEEKLDAFEKYVKAYLTLEKKLKNAFPNKAKYMAFKPGDADEKILE